MEHVQHHPCHIHQNGRLPDRHHSTKGQIETMISSSRTVSGQSNFASLKSCHRTKNSPTFLAQQRVLRKYHRPHVSKAVGRKLCLDTGTDCRKKKLQRWSTCMERNGKFESDPKMPKLCDVKVVVEKLDLQQRNGMIQSKSPQNDHGPLPYRTRGRLLGASKRDSKEDNSVEAEQVSLHLSESEDEDMPHLQKVSTEEKAVELSVKQSRIWPQDIQPIPSIQLLEKLKTLKNHGKLSTQSNEKTQNGEIADKNPLSDNSQGQCIAETPKGTCQKNGLTSRRNVFSIFEQAFQATQINCHDRPESMPDLTEAGEKNSVGSISPLEMPELDDETNEICTVVSGSSMADISNSAGNQSALAGSVKDSTKISKLTRGPTLRKDKTAIPPVLKRAHKSILEHAADDSSCVNVKKKKCSVSECGVQADFEDSVNGASASQMMLTHSGQGSLTFMTDLTELKHDREDQTEFYPDSFSSLDEDLVIQSVVKPVKSRRPSYVKQGHHKTNHRESSKHKRDAGASDDEEWTPQKYRRRHNTIDGSHSREAGQSVNVVKVRERRQRPRSLSHGCTCCMDHGSGRKRRKRRPSHHMNGMTVRHTAWTIPTELSPDQQKYVQNCTVLIALRHKVYRLCQVLFPKLQHTWPINPDTENVDLLVAQITGVVNTLDGQAGMGHSGGPEIKSEHCESKTIPSSAESETESTEHLATVETLHNSKTGESHRTECLINHMHLVNDAGSISTLSSDGLNVACSSALNSCLHPSKTSETNSNRRSDELSNSNASSQNGQMSTNNGCDFDSYPDTTCCSTKDESKDNCSILRESAPSRLDPQAIDCDMVGGGDPMLPNLNSEQTTEVNGCDKMGKEEVMPLLECYKSDVGLCPSPCTSDRTAFSSEDQWLVLDSIEEESTSLPPLFEDEGELAPPAPNLVPFSDQSNPNAGSTDIAMETLSDMGTLPDIPEVPSSSKSTVKQPKAWESEFMKYLSGREAFGSSAGDSADDDCAENVDKASAGPSPVMMPSGDSGVHSVPLDGPATNIGDYDLLDIKVALCNNPQACLTRLRKQITYLLKPLLPNLTFENNFDKFSDDVDLLVDLVRESNETKEMRSSGLSPAVARS